MREGALRAATAVAVGLCSFTYIQTKDSPAIRRPHPGVWRAFYGVARELVNSGSVTYVEGDAVKGGRRELHRRVGRDGLPEAQV